MYSVRVVTHSVIVVAVKADEAMFAGDNKTLNGANAELGI